MVRNILSTVQASRGGATCTTLVDGRSRSINDLPADADRPAQPTVIKDLALAHNAVSDPCCGAVSYQGQQIDSLVQREGHCAIRCYTGASESTASKSASLTSEYHDRLRGSKPALSSSWDHWPGPATEATVGVDARRHVSIWHSHETSLEGFAAGLVVENLWTRASAAPFNSRVAIYTHVAWYPAELSFQWRPLCTPLY